jgi:hypothetical protein
VRACVIECGSREGRTHTDNGESSNNFSIAASADGNSERGISTGLVISAASQTALKLSFNRRRPGPDQISPGPCVTVLIKKKSADGLGR